MKKFIILLITALMVNLSVNAQETSKKFGLLDKWSVGFETAIQTNLHDWNKPQGLILGVTINKDINPYYGLSVETTIGFNNRKNYNLEIINADKPIDQITVSLINRWNITNTIYGYNGTPHKFEVEMLVGLGGLHDFGDSFVYLWGPGTKFEDFFKPVYEYLNVGIAKSFPKNIIIFGHSVDPLDKEIFQKCFALAENGKYDYRFVFTYFDEPAKRSIIKNLTIILGKEKLVELTGKRNLVFIKSDDKDGMKNVLLS